MSLSTAEPAPDAELHSRKQVTCHVTAEQKQSANQKVPQQDEAPPQTTQPDGNDYAHIWQCTLMRPDKDNHSKDNERNMNRQCKTLPRHIKCSGERHRPVTIGEPEEFYSTGMGAFHSHMPDAAEIHHERLPDVTLPRAAHLHPRGPAIEGGKHIIAPQQHQPGCSFAKPRYFVLDQGTILKEVTDSRSRDPAGNAGPSRTEHSPQCIEASQPEHTRQCATLDFRTFKQ